MEARGGGCLLSGYRGDRRRRLGDSRGRKSGLEVIVVTVAVAVEVGVVVDELGLCRLDYISVGREVEDTQKIVRSEKNGREGRKEGIKGYGRER